MSFTEILGLLLILLIPGVFFTLVGFTGCIPTISIGQSIGHNKN